MLFTVAACGTEKPANSAEQQTAAASEAEQASFEWTRQGYFTDENENMLSVTWMEDIDEPGWYVGLMVGEIMGGSTLPQENGTLHGNLNAWDETAEPLIVTVSEEGEDGLLLEIEGGESYHFKPYDMPEATIVVTVNTEGWGNIDYAEGDQAPEIDTEYPMQSAYIGLAEPKTHTFVAWPQAGSMFVKWTKNGEDFSTEPVITVLLDESAEYIAVFEEDPGWQNPVMNFVGNYQSDRAHALVECFGADEAWITIEWGGSAWEFARWLIVGRLDTETLTIAYEGANKSVITVNDSGEESAEEVYMDGTGTITFHGTAPAPSPSMTTEPLPGTRISPSTGSICCLSGSRRLRKLPGRTASVLKRSSSSKAWRRRCSTSTSSEGISASRWITIMNPLSGTAIRSLRASSPSGMGPETPRTFLR